MSRRRWRSAVHRGRSAARFALACLPALSGAPAAAQVAGEVPGRIAGVVREGGAGGAPVPHALVEVVGSGGGLVVAGRDGRYVLPDVAPGTRRIRFSQIGYRPLEVEVVVPPAGVVSLDAGLDLRPVEVGPLVVTGHPGAVVPERGEDPTRELAELALRTLETTPGFVESGLAGAAGAMGGGDPADPSDVLFLRGSAADMKLVLLDGAPVYAPFHLGGVMEGFDPSTLGRAALYTGGAPARYDGGLSYILELESRRPRSDRIRGSGAVDAMGARASLETPLGDDAGIVASARGLHGLGAGLFGGERSPYGYAEGLAVVEVAPLPGHRIAASAFGNRESVALDLPVTGDASWANRALTAGYAGIVGGSLLEARVAGSRYRAALPLRDSVPSFVRGTTDRLRATVDVVRPGAGGGELRFGASLDRTRVTHRVAGLRTGEALRDPEVLDETVAGAYLEATRPLGPSFRLRTGLRGDHFIRSDDFRLAPRASLAWLLSEDATLTVAAGSYHQSVRTTGEEVPDAAASEAREAGDGGALPVVSASHLRISLDQTLTPGVALVLDGFLKAFDGVPGVAGGRLDVSGLDLRAVRTGDPVRGWLGYSLSWFWTDEGRELPSGSFAGRHLVSGGVSGRLWGSAAFDVRLAYSDRLSYTAVPLDVGEGLPFPATRDRTDLVFRSRKGVGEDPAFSGGPEEGFLRVDVELSALVRPRWGGRTVEIRPYLRLLNALDRRDALFYYFEPWRDADARPVAERPLLPVLGAEWRF